MQKAEQVEPINTLLLEQEVVKWKNQPSERTQHFVTVQKKKGENRMRETKKKLLQETVTILKKLDKESLAIIRSNAEILRARDTLEEQKAG